MIVLMIDILKSKEGKISLEIFHQNYVWILISVGIIVLLYNCITDLFCTVS